MNIQRKPVTEAFRIARVVAVAAATMMGPSLPATAGGIGGSTTVPSNTQITKPDCVIPASLPPNTPLPSGCNFYPPKVGSHDEIKALDENPVAVGEVGHCLAVTNTNPDGTPLSPGRTKAWSDSSTRTLRLEVVLQRGPQYSLHSYTISENDGFLMDEVTPDAKPTPGNSPTSIDGVEYTGLSYLQPDEAYPVLTGRVRDCMQRGIRLAGNTLQRMAEMTPSAKPQ